MFLLIYWIICGLITFSLTNPTVYVTTFKHDNILEFILSMLFGGLVVPVLAIAFVGDLIILLFERGE